MSVTYSPSAPRTAARTTRPSDRLRTVLSLNAVTSGVGGILGLVAAGWWSKALGIDSAFWTRLVSAGLVLFAIDVALVASRARARLNLGALAVSVADVLWVAATVVVLALADLSTFGTVIAVMLGIGVADFAVLQLWFRSKNR